MSDHPRLSLQDIILEASELVGRDRVEFVERACACDSALRAEVESLLAFDRETPSILDDGALGRVVESVLGQPQGAATGVGDRVGAYTLVEVIGEGGMGVVYRALQHGALARSVALKLVRKGLDTDRVVARFEAERQALARMDHPGIARVFDAGATADGRPYFVMELVTGQPITTYADEARLSVRERVVLLRQVCLAVQHAHRKGVIHRDLKPSNILASSRDDGHDVKVIDFGVAKAIVPDGRDTLVTLEGQLVGTPNYMSPEQAGVVDADVDTRADVYAAGVILYELLAGRRPHEFERATVADIRRVFDSTQAVRPSTAVSAIQRLALSAGRVPTGMATQVAVARSSTPARLRRDLAGDLDNIVLKAIETSPERRYASMEQFADDLGRFLGGRPVMARPATLEYRARKFAQRHALGVAIAAMATLFLVAVVATTVVQSGQLARERDRAVAAEQRARLEADTASRTAAFLSGVFKVNDPSESRGRSVTAMELLDRSAQEIGEGLADQPALQARLMVTMGNVYKQLGLYESAAGLLQQALNVRERTPGIPPRDIADALDALGDVLRYASEGRRAVEVLQRAVDLQRADPSVTPEARASAINNLGLARQELGDYAQARPLLLEALDVRRRVFADAMDTATREDARDKLAGSLNNVGSLLSTTDRLREAEAMLRESLSLREAARPPRIVSLALSRTSLAMNLMRQGRPGEAEPLLRQVVADRTMVLGPGHPQTVAAIAELAVAFHDMGRFDLAERHYRDVVSARAATKDLGGYAVALNNLASLLEDRGNFAEARPLLEKSLELRKSVNGQKHPSVATALNNLGRLEFALGNSARARLLLDEALDIRRERFGTDSLPVAATLAVIARVRHAQGEVREAESDYRAALGILRSRLSPTHANVISVEVGLGRVLLDLGRPTEAEPLLRHAVEVRATPPPATAVAWRLAEAHLALGRALVGVGKVADGRAMIRAAAPLVVSASAAHPTLKDEARRALRR